MNTVEGNLKEMATEIQSNLKDLLINHSSIYLWNKPNSTVFVVSVSGNYAFNNLKDNGMQIQAKILDDYRKFHSLLNALMKGQPQDCIGKLAENDDTLLNLIEQKHTWCKDVHEAYEKATKALQEELDLLNRLPKTSSDSAIIIPDTNALLYNPDIETWSFPKISPLLIVLLPTVMAELDKLKINHRNEDVRRKSESLIKRIKEYRRRGNLLTGIVIVKNKIAIKALAIEPDMKNSLPWLDSNNSDDRIIASIIEVMRFYPKQLVAVVSRDINFQNKADFARIPFVEPPKPNILKSDAN
jgi:hypothetical protein